MKTIFWGQPNHNAVVKRGEWIVPQRPEIAFPLLLALPLTDDRYATVGADALLARASSSATVTDNEDISHTCFVNEFRFTKAQRVRNVITSQDLTTWAVERAGTGAVPTITDQGGGVYRVQMTRGAGDTSGDRVAITIADAADGSDYARRMDIMSNTASEQLVLMNWSEAVSERIAPVGRWASVSYTNPGGGPNYQKFYIATRGTYGGSLTIDILVRFTQTEVVTGKSNQVSSYYVEPNGSACHSSDIPVMYSSQGNGNSLIKGEIVPGTTPIYNLPGLYIGDAANPTNATTADHCTAPFDVGITNNILIGLQWTPDIVGGTPAMLAIGTLAITHEAGQVVFHKGAAQLAIDHIPVKGQSVRIWAQTDTDGMSLQVGKYRVQNKEGAGFTGATSVNIGQDASQLNQLNGNIQDVRIYDTSGA